MTLGHIQPADLNLYAFYRDVALRFDREVLGNGPMTPARHARLHQVLSDLQTAYFQDGAIDYSDPDRIVAYTLSFAPKHALIWRELAKQWTLSSDRWRLNSIGPGPGSDIIGMLCGVPGADQVTVDIVGLEAEESWRQMLDFTRETFLDLTGMSFELLMTKDSDYLHPEGQIIGSLVLTDAARNGTLANLLSDICRCTAKSEMWFLDFPTFTCPQSGKSNIKEAIRKCGLDCRWSYVPDLNLGIKEVIAGQIDSCDPIYCKRTVSDEPKVSLFKVTRK